MQVLKIDMDAGDQRRRAYPPITDQLDAVMKLAAHLRASGMELPPDVCDWVDACQEVKRRYPITKPDDNQPA